MTLTSAATTFLSVMTVIGDIFIAITLLLFIFKRFSKGLNKLFESLMSFTRKNAIWMAFVVATLSTFGSLFYSEIAKYDPCKLCWIQRIFMYPQAIILLIAMLRKDKDIKVYMLPLSVIGLLFAGYHYLLQINPNVPSSCGITGVGASCASSPFFHFGYITIPMMAFTAFGLLIIGYLSLRKKK